MASFAVPHRPSTPHNMYIVCYKKIHFLDVNTAKSKDSGFIFSMMLPDSPITPCGDYDNLFWFARLLMQPQQSHECKSHFWNKKLTRILGGKHNKCAFLYMFIAYELNELSYVRLKLEFINYRSPSNGVSGGPAISPRSLVYVSSTNSILHFSTYKVDIHVEIRSLWTQSHVNVLYIRLKSSKSYSISRLGREV